jgi:hypothetical protein
VTCIGCIHHVQDWRLCLHPLSQSSGFWADANSYACRVEKDVPEARFGNIATQPTLSPIPAGATPGEQAP